MQFQTTTLSDDKLHELAQDPSNKVLRYTYDNPERIMSPTDQLGLFRGVVAAFDAACLKYPDLADDALRERVLSTRPDVREFQHLYPKVFASVTMRCHKEADVDRLDKIRKLTMLSLVERLQNKGTLEDQKARTLEAALRSSLRPATEAERAAAGTMRLDPSTLPAGALDPLPATAFGECTVRQA